MALFLKNTELSKIRKKNGQIQPLKYQHGKPYKREGITDIDIHMFVDVDQNGNVTHFEKQKAEDSPSTSPRTSNQITVIRGQMIEDKKENETKPIAPLDVYDSLSARIKSIHQRREVLIFMSLLSEGKELTREGMPELPILNAELRKAGLPKMKSRNREKLFNELNKLNAL